MAYTEQSLDITSPVAEDEDDSQSAQPLMRDLWRIFWLLVGNPPECGQHVFVLEKRKFTQPRCVCVCGTSVEMLNFLFYI